jgi:hypothetical protein
MSDCRCLADSQTPPVSYIAAVYIQTADRQTYLGKQLLLDMRLYTPRFDIRTP